MKTISELKEETIKELSRRIIITARSELEILEAKIERHYKNGALNVSDIALSGDANKAKQLSKQQSIGKDKAIELYGSKLLKS